MNVETWQQSLEQITNLHRQKDYVSALKLIKSLLVHSPYSVELLIRYAKLIQLLDKENIQEFPLLNTALYCLNIAYSFAPNNPETCMELGYFEYAVLDHPDRAIIYFEEAKNNAKSVLKTALTSQIRCYIERRFFSEAKKILEEATQYFPDDNELSLVEFELEYSESNL